jgi:mannose-6-phosphate isomerase-like protein (cupin superfamily)
MKTGPHALDPIANLDPNPYDPATEPDIDMFMGSFLESNPFRTHGSLIERHILTRGDGDTVKPQKKAAVLKYANRVTHASLMGFLKTQPVNLAGEQEIFYIISGEGTITSKTTTLPLRPGTAVLAPAGCEFVLENTGGETLDMYLISEPTPPGFRPNPDILVVAEADRPYYTSNTHWIGVAKTLLTTADGLGTLESVQVVTFDPMTFFHPHSHVEGTEEVWTAIDKECPVLIGKEVRLQRPGTAYMIPTTGETPHANFNVSGEPVTLFYFARYGDHDVRP